MHHDRQTRRQYVRFVTALEEATAPFFQWGRERDQSLEKELEALNQEWTVPTDQKGEDGNLIYKLKDDKSDKEWQLVQKAVADKYYEDIKTKEKEVVEIPYTNASLRAFVNLVWNHAMPDPEAMENRKMRNHAIKETQLADKIDILFTTLFPDLFTDEPDSTDRA